jgi:hypothetical protein
MTIPAVARWYADVARHMDRCKGRSKDRACPTCTSLQSRMAALKIKHADNS